jgi:hypothetical protein
MRLLSWIGKLLGFGDRPAGRPEETPLFLMRLEDRQVLDAIAVTTFNDNPVDGNTSSIAALQGDPGADGLITLREAIIAANNSPGDDIIQLQAGTYSFADQGPGGETGENAAAKGDLDIVNANTAVAGGTAGKVTIQGAGANVTVIDAEGIDRVFEVLPGGDLTIQGVTLTGGDPGTQGSPSGGGILVTNPTGQQPTGKLTVLQSAVEGNTAKGGGGGIASFQGTIVIRDSTISGNTAGTGAGGIEINKGDLKLINSTVSGNTDVQGNFGGGLAVKDAGATATIVNSTITNNSAKTGGAAFFGGGTNVVMNNTIAAGNFTDGSIDNAQIAGSFTGSNNFTSGDPKLNPLANNGGPTKTHLPMDGSPVIDAGSDALAKDPTTGTYPSTSTPLAFDQRGTGFPRIQGAAVDIGAVEATAVNQAPAGADKTVTTAEDTDYVFKVADFGFSDPDGDAFLAVKITTLPGNGTLTYDGTPITTPGVTIAVEDINLNKLKFTPDPNENGTSYASFTFQVQDDGGGDDLDQSPNTMTIDVTPVNDPPAGTNKTVTTAEDTAYTFTAADFGFSDPFDSPADNFLAVKITTLPGNGTLTYDGTPITTPGVTISVEDINLNKLKFVPDANENGVPYTSFTFQVQDDGGGDDLDQSPNTMTIDVTPVNDPPAGADNTVTTAEDTAYTFTEDDFGFSDPFDSPADAFLAVKITTLPGQGTLTNGVNPVSAGDTISLADINAGKLKFTPDPNENGTPYTSFTFQVQDDGGGSDLDPTPNLMVINVTPVDDCPTVTLDNVVDINENDYATLTGSFTNPDLDSTHTVVVDWDDPNDATDSTFDLGATSSLFVGQTFNSSDGAVLEVTDLDLSTGTVSFSVKHQYLDDGKAPGNATISDTSTIKVTVTSHSTISTPATPGVVSYGLDFAFSGSPASTTVPWVTITFEDDTADPTLPPNTVRVTMEATGLVGNQFITDWFFNLDPSLNPTLLTFDTLTATKTGTFNNPAISTGANSFKADGDGFFDVKFEFANGPPAARFGAGDKYVILVSSTQTLTGESFKFVSVNGSPGKDGFGSAAHLQGGGGTWIANGESTQEVTCEATLSTKVLVKNVPPALTTVGNQTATKNTLLSLPALGTFTDVGTLDKHPTVTVDWGDGSPVEDGIVTKNGGVSTIAGDHIYFSSGTFTVTVTVIDDDGASAVKTFQVVVPSPPDTGVGVQITSGFGAERGGGGPPQTTLRSPENVTLVHREELVVRREEEERHSSALERRGEEDDAVILEVLSPDQKVVQRVVLSLDVLKDLDALYRRLPDGWYMLLLRRNGREVPVFPKPFLIRAGRVIDPARADETPDRPPAAKKPGMETPMPKELSQADLPQADLSQADLSQADVERLWQQLAAQQAARETSDGQAPLPVPSATEKPGTPTKAPPLPAAGQRVDATPPGESVAADVLETQDATGRASAAASAAVFFSVATVKAQEPNQERGAAAETPLGKRPGTVARILRRVMKWFGLGR